MVRCSAARPRPKRSIIRALFSYSKVEAKSGPPSICLVDKGTGTLSELVSKLRADDIYYGYVRLVVGDATSVSTKFLFATYVGGQVSPLKRARVSVHKTVFAKSLPVRSAGLSLAHY